MSLRVTVNGKSHTVAVPEDMPLLWVLRDVLSLTGTKFGCGTGQCRACTVLLDGKPVQSCMTSVKRGSNGKIVTIEGLTAASMEKTGSLHHVQQAWLDEQVVQCGGCQPGMILSTVALLERNPRPSDTDIDDALGGHLCRCGTYQRIRKAVHRAAGGGQ